MTGEKPAPDPDEDDLDDLDDVLDQFSTTKDDLNVGGKEAPSASGPGRPAPPESGQEPQLDENDDFARELQAGMADLMREMESSPELQRQLDSLVKDFDVASAAASSSHGNREQVERPPTAGKGDGTGKGKGSEDGGASKPAETGDFQETIRRMMERMEHSGEEAGRAATSGSEDDILAQMLKEMEKGNFGGEETDEDFSKMLMGMMEQLTNKDILYEPMKELHDKFPAWLEKNKDTVAPDDLKRYNEQRQLVDEIVARFELSGYSDDNVKDREFIVDKMQKMQSAGSPPPDLVGDMNAAQEALGDLEAGCPQQ